MKLGELSTAVGQLRTMAAPDRRAAVADLLPDLQAHAIDARVVSDVRINLLLRALRAVSPRAARPDTPAEALAALRSALAAERGPGRPRKGSPHTIRVPDDVWARVEQLAGELGVSESDAAARLIEQALDAP